MGDSEFLASLRLYHSSSASLLSPSPPPPTCFCITSAAASSFSPTNVSSTISLVIFSSGILSVSSAFFIASSNSFFSSAPGNFIPEVDTDADVVVGALDDSDETPGFVLPAKYFPPLKTIYVTVAKDVLL